MKRAAHTEPSHSAAIRAVIAGPKPAPAAQRTVNSQNRDRETPRSASRFALAHAGDKR